MRALLLISAIALTACNPPSDDTLGEFSAFNASVIGDDICHFGEMDRAEEAWFAVDRSENGLAYTRYKGETLKLLPIKALSVDEDRALSGRFGAIDYPRWEVTVDGEDVRAASYPPGFDITIRLQVADQTIAEATNLYGRCAI